MARNQLTSRRNVTPNRFWDKQIRGDVMRKLSKLIAGLALALGVVVAFFPGRSSNATQQANPASQPAQNSKIQVRITTGGGLFGPPISRYRVGERVPVTINMTNTSDQPVEICDSATIYQDRPRLLRNGQPVPYLIGQTQILNTTQKDRTCFKLDVPEPVRLKPKESRVVDWFVLADGSQSLGDLTWYEPLVPGNYGLSIERRLACCEGPMIPSNQINFEVVP